jgi:hypothetical protein
LEKETITIDLGANIRQACYSTYLPMGDNTLEGWIGFQKSGAKKGYAKKEFRSPLNPAWVSSGGLLVLASASWYRKSFFMMWYSYQHLRLFEHRESISKALAS